MVPRIGVASVFGFVLLGIVATVTAVASSNGVSTNSRGAVAAAFPSSGKYVAKVSDMAPAVNGTWTLSIDLGGPPGSNGNFGLDKKGDGYGGKILFKGFGLAPGTVLLASGRAYGRSKLDCADNQAIGIFGFSLIGKSLSFTPVEVGCSGQLGDILTRHTFIKATPPAPPAAQTCTTQVGRITWHLSATSVPCAIAARIIRNLAISKIPRASPFRFPGTYPYASGASPLICYGYLATVHKATTTTVWRDINCRNSSGARVVAANEFVYRR